MKTSLILFLISLNAMALDCGDIPEGTTVRIDKGEGSLAKAAVQDQDGIGSCYANQASLLLQSILPGNPNISYLNLGLFYTQENNLPESRKKGEKSYARDAVTLDNKVIKDGSTAIWGGTSCETINILIEKQKSDKFAGICKAEDVNIEHNFFDPKTGNSYDFKHTQNQAIASASKYMNAYQHKFGFAFDKKEEKNAPAYLEKRKKADEFREALKKFVETNSDPYLVKKCTVPDNEKITNIIDSTVSKAFLNSKECYDHRTRIKTDSAICKNFDKMGFLYTKSSNSNNAQSVAYEMSKDSKSKIFAEVSKALSNPAGFEMALKNIETSFAPYENFKNTVPAKTPKEKKVPVVKNARGKRIPAPEEKNTSLGKVVLENLSPEDRKTLQAEYKRVTLQEIDECKSNNMIEFFKDKDQFVKMALQDSVLCQHVDLIQRASEFAGVLPLKTFNNVSTFLGFITDKAGLDYDQGLLAMMASDCTPEKRIRIPNTTTCENKLMSFEPEDFPGDSVSEKAKRVIKENRARLFSDLKNNRGIGLDICTKFWSDGNYDFHKENSATKNNTCEQSGEHGFHAITMIGYRCQNNKIQYLSQNSWGPNWETKVSSFDVDEGKIWMDEDKVFKNLQGIDYITP